MKTDQIIIASTLLVSHALMVASAPPPTTTATTTTTTMLDPSFNITKCAAGSLVTALPSCDYFNGRLNSCPDLPTVEQRRACLCNQDFFNSMFECESELRLCFLAKNLDSTIENAVEEWHQACDKYAAVTLTTPPVSTIASTMQRNDDFCLTDVVSACQSALIGLSRCSNSMHDATQFSSCTCQPQLLSNAYTCEYLQTVSCMHASNFAVSDMVFYSLCDNFASVIGTGLVPGTDAINSPVLYLAYSKPLSDYHRANAYRNDQLPGNDQPPDNDNS
ncbi:hypothetical protein B0T26DRAFT_676243 [Lasiosphaeria miniovina]|uniref:Extracellular membrane protein CFEM domain-containing protein n=1 Tax=Lasiosphaeria miniovina TaxID=1954250 RepID=A0AA40ALH7_9PEZI|nr:uncharacterized protein B0T26DRAFT_676243 [Lasiosphaeria miniovina]KAK0718019.1 hypothetical protein B0T26DRAFT_676243 [Lasiosphaeria miniovina]